MELAAAAVDEGSEEEERDAAETTAAHLVYRAYTYSLALAVDPETWQGYPAVREHGARRFEATAVAFLGGGLWLHHTLRITEADGASDVLTLIVPCTVAAATPTSSSTRKTSSWNSSRSSGPPTACPCTTTARRTAAAFSRFRRWAATADHPSRGRTPAHSTYRTRRTHSADSPGCASFHACCTMRKESRMTSLTYPELPENPLVVLIGASGAGKSTLADTWPASQVLSLCAALGHPPDRCSGSGWDGEDLRGVDEGVTRLQHTEC
ncbi:hypothetical protein QF035_010658 [Streptomyces umbrinus]|uniref:Uncharacterized protein n=1 Tax=Streptomyces umbrinus TaxID=67370 RepID=A0ABU0TB83_9ACTN|nr:hypothetical protein [Streptomyces umbrinus]